MDDDVHNSDNSLQGVFQISIQALILPTGANSGLGKAIWRPLAERAHHLRSLCASNSCWADVLGLLQVRVTSRRYEKML